MVEMLGCKSMDDVAHTAVSFKYTDQFVTCMKAHAID